MAHQKDEFSGADGVTVVKHDAFQGNLTRGVSGSSLEISLSMLGTYMLKAGGRSLYQDPVGSAVPLSVSISVMEEINKLKKIMA